MDKRQLYEDFTYVIGMIATENDKELLQHRMINDNIFRCKMKKTIAILMQCVAAYEAKEPFKEYSIRKQIESEIRLHEVLDLIKDKT